MRIRDLAPYTVLNGGIRDIGIDNQKGMRARWQGGTLELGDRDRLDRCPVLEPAPCWGAGS